MLCTIQPAPRNEEVYAYIFWIASGTWCSNGPTRSRIVYLAATKSRKMKRKYFINNSKAVFHSSRGNLRTTRKGNNVGRSSTPTFSFRYLALSSPYIIDLLWNNNNLHFMLAWSAWFRFGSFQPVKSNHVYFKEYITINPRTTVAKRNVKIKLAHYAQLPLLDDVSPKTIGTRWPNTYLDPIQLARSKKG